MQREQRAAVKLPLQPLGLTSPIVDLGIAAASFVVVNRDTDGCKPGRSRAAPRTSLCASPSRTELSDQGNRAGRLESSPAPAGAWSNRSPVTPRWASLLTRSRSGLPQAAGFFHRSDPSASRPEAEDLALANVSIFVRESANVVPP